MYRKTATLTRAVSAVGQWFWRPLRDKLGGTAMLIAFATIPILGAGGLAVDLSLAYMLKNQMSKALDTAGLAAGRVAYAAYAADDGQKFFNANFNPELLDATLTSFDVQFSANNETLTLTASAEMPTRFMRLFGRDMVSVSARTVIRRSSIGMELALVIDDTGSMTDGTKLQDAKDAAHELLAVVYGTEATLPNVFVAVVPYVTAVNVGPARTGWLYATDNAIVDTNAWNDVPSGELPGWAGCVMARPAPYDQNDATPAVVPFTSWLWESGPENNWPPMDYTGSTQHHGNLSCTVPITSLTQNRATVDAAIDAIPAMPKKSGTAVNLGLVWGWRTLSPNWKGLWGGETPVDMPFDYEEPLMEKVIVILTDGENVMLASDYNGYGRLDGDGVGDFDFTNSGDARNELDARTVATCTAMKNEGIIIYALTFGSGIDAQAQATMQACATQPNAPYYFHAPDGDDLSAAFVIIGTELSNLRIAE